MLDKNYQTNLPERGAANPARQAKLNPKVADDEMVGSIT
jgi:hypothetical protein